MLQVLLQNKALARAEVASFSASLNVRFNEMDIMGSCIDLSSMHHRTCLGHQGGHPGPTGSISEGLPLAWAMGWRRTVRWWGCWTP